MLSEQLRNVINKKKKRENSATALLIGNNFEERPPGAEGKEVLTAPLCDLVLHNYLVILTCTKRASQSWIWEVKRMTLKEKELQQI